MPNPRKDIAGVTFGWLTAIRFVFTKGNHTMWLCECECGGSKTVSLHNLQSGYATNCGCVRQRKQQFKIPTMERPIVNSQHHFSGGIDIPCSTFGCPLQLSPQEQLFGNKCFEHMGVVNDINKALSL